MAKVPEGQSIADFIKNIKGEKLLAFAALVSTRVTQRIDVLKERMTDDIHLQLRGDMLNMITETQKKLKESLK